jgi:hypothetical protein
MARDLGPMLVSILMAGSLVVGPSPAVAAEVALELDSPSAMKTNLERTVGQRVKLRLMTGQELEGVVTKVGATAVHLASLSGMDFYDAVVRLDHVSAVIMRMRGR